MSKFEIGDAVRIIDTGCVDICSLYDGVARGYMPSHNMIGYIKELSESLYLVELIFGKLIIISEFGLEKYSLDMTQKKDDVKETNPKDAIGSKKHPLNIVPDTLNIYAAMAFAEGGAKYSPFNWRVAGIRASVYKAAHDRHMAKWWNGEDCDPETNVPHLASAIACLAIILDANLCGKMNDDRPPYAPIRELIEECEKVVAFVNELHKDKRGTLKEYKLSDYPNVELNEPI